MTPSIKKPNETGQWYSVLCKLSLAGAAIVPAFVAGCAMCCGTNDYEYPMFQSNYSRTDPEHGRVGSLFTDSNVGLGVRPLTNADVPVENGIKRNQEPDADAPVDPNFEKDPFEGEDPETAQPTEQDTATRFQFPTRR